MPSVEASGVVGERRSARRRGAAVDPDHALPRVLAPVPADPRREPRCRRPSPPCAPRSQSCSSASTSTGFFWGDCSLSNALFRRDAGALSAYLVDAETSELHDRLSDGQRTHDLDIAEENLAGELYDLAAELGRDVVDDPFEFGSERPRARTTSCGTS